MELKTVFINYICYWITSFNRTAYGIENAVQKYRYKQLLDF